jgi:plastocyanin
MMGFGQFSGNTSVSIKAGQAVNFDDSSGGPHNLVTGMHGSPSAESGAPQQLGAPGLMFQGGDAHTVTFANKGTYNITCTFHPSMQATVTVS